MSDGPGQSASTDTPATVPGTDASTADASVHSFGMWVLIASLSVLFLCSLFLYWLLRSMQEQWPPPGAHGLPVTIWLSTALLAASSFTIERARAARRDRRASSLRVQLVVSAILGWVFLVAQAFNWWELLAVHAEAGTDLTLHAMVFLLLTGLHALHVIGGVIPLTVLASKASRPDAVEPHRDGPLGAMAMYWHFLGIVWLVMFVTIFLPGG